MARKVVLVQLAVLRCWMHGVLWLACATAAASPTDDNSEGDDSGMYCSNIKSSETIGSRQLGHPESTSMDSSTVTNGQSNQDSVMSEHPHSDDDDQCTLYIAESTIPNAGLGIFTTEPYDVGQPIGNPDLCLPYFLYDSQESLTSSMYDYAWQGHAVGMQREGLRTSALCPGLGSLVNCHIPLINARRGLPRYDPLSTTRPSAGAISPYAHVTPVAVRNIPMGSEIFQYYGDHWFEKRTPSLGYLPLLMDYHDAQRLLERFYNMTRQFSQSTTLDLYQVVRKIKQLSEKSRIMNAFPTDWTDALSVGRENATFADLEQPQYTRNKEWLAHHGRCINHITSRTSIIPDAGRGAFATRALHRGQVITVSPLHHVVNAEILNQYHVAASDEYRGHVRHLDKIEGAQVGLNYCFGHAESTLLLCPFGAGVSFLNHASQNTSQKANVVIQWARNFAIVHNHTLVEEEVLSRLGKVEHPSLAFEYVALRDILPGEELLIDYGSDWEKAWEKHLKRWENLNRSVVSSAHDMNHDPDHYMLRTLSELKVPSTSYPSNVEIRCHRDVIKPFVHGRKYTWGHNYHGYPCRILERYEMEKDHSKQNSTLSDSTDGNTTTRWLYTIQIDVAMKEGKTATPIRLTRPLIPREAFLFFDKAGTTDLFSKSAFRHWIGVPEDLFPARWKNKK